MEFDEVAGLSELVFAASSDQGGLSDQGDSGDPALLERNLAALAIRSPQAAQLIAQSPGRGDAAFFETEQGVGATLGGVALASKRRPLDEARRLAERVDPQKVACSIVHGFALGYHCEALRQRHGKYALVICFEPDVSLMRSVLSHVDCTALFSSGQFHLVTDPEDTTRMTRVFEGAEVFVGMGIEVVAHPPSVARLAGQSERFSEVFTGVLKSARTHVMTTLSNSRITFRNALMNAEHYARCAGISSLEGSCAGKPAIVVSAGPSLERNLGLLADPAVRESFVIIAVQTVLKPMLARGIRPHFVAALDYHELSKRFFEGLTAQDVRGVRLVVEPKANPAILDAFPGEILCVGDRLLDTALGEGLAREMGEVEPGATVAHLCAYLARLLGCDPVILIGQDLGFTDGQYYAAGAAIHTAWAGELSTHRSLEMFEWERIVRMRAYLRRLTDVEGRSIYSDEQMCAYLAQFEADFARDTEKGLRVIDATEGGVRKAHTEVMTLREAIGAFAGRGALELPETGGERREGEQWSGKIEARLKSLADDCERIAHHSERSIEKLGAMLRHQDDQRRVNELIGEVNAIRDRVMGMGEAFALCEFVNQVGVLNRFKRDRAIGVGEAETGLEKQRRQIERDISNVEWTRDAARTVARQLRSAREVVLGRAHKQVGDARGADLQDEPELAELAGRTRDRVHALALADPELSGLGTTRDLTAMLGGGRSIIGTTIARLDRCEQLDAITVVSPEPERIRSMLTGVKTRLPLNVVGVDKEAMRRHTLRVGAARVHSGSSWRGSIGLLSVFDEQADPALLAPVMRERDIDACVIVGADWAMIDPDLVDQTVSRLRGQPEKKRIAFSQAVPGIGTMALDIETMSSLEEGVRQGSVRRNHFATIGALLGYIPVAPQPDPIGKGVCVQIDPALRDAGLRIIADTPARTAAMRDACTALGDPIGADALACVDAFGETYKRYRKICPQTIVLETCTGRLAGGDWGAWKRGSVEPVERPVLSMNDAHRLLGSIRELRDDVALIFDGAGDPLMHPDALGLVALAKEDGAASVELRTDLLRDGIGAGTLVGSGVDILSVDVLAERRETYAMLTGQDRFEQVLDRAQAVFDAMRDGGGDGPWFVPRITRCDAVYEEIEAFYDRWLHLCGCAVIDPTPAMARGQRIAPLPVPGWRQAQLDRATMRVRCDGTVVDRAGAPIMAQGEAINAIEEGLAQAHQKMCSAMRASQIELKARAGEYAA